MLVLAHQNVHMEPLTCMSLERIDAYVMNSDLKKNKNNSNKHAKWQK